MKKLLIHGRNSKASSGSGSSFSGTLSGVCFYEGYYGAMMYQPVTVYVPGTDNSPVTTTCTEWQEGDGFDIYLFGSFSNADISMLECYVDGVKTNDRFDDFTMQFTNEAKQLDGVFDNILDVYATVPFGTHTVEIKTSEGTLLHKSIVNLTSESGDRYTSGTIYNVYPAIAHIYSIDAPQTLSIPYDTEILLWWECSPKTATDTYNDLIVTLSNENVVLLQPTIYYDEIDDDKLYFTSLFYRRATGTTYMEIKRKSDNTRLAYIQITD